MKNDALRLRQLRHRAAKQRYGATAAKMKEARNARRQVKRNIAA
jgi:hypothetical protein